eukprot:TRINITY_DN4208_c0_g1_i1.p2 TRINITY_DN4208_c0_g1~~TRINITY_DN4208_c0_g1_i1.p2  ORF type:complete len:118 (+),score=17.65 TRINITY_DN4208_c0_g1_i1:133-486(+)
MTALVYPQHMEMYPTASQECWVPPFQPLPVRSCYEQERYAEYMHQSYGQPMMMPTPCGATAAGTTDKKKKKRRKKGALPKPDPRADPMYWLNAPDASECAIVPVDEDPIPHALIAAM